MDYVLFEPDPIYHENLNVKFGHGVHARFKSRGPLKKHDFSDLKPDTFREFDFD